MMRANCSNGALNHLSSFLDWFGALEEQFRLKKVISLSLGYLFMLNDVDRVSISNCQL